VPRPSQIDEQRKRLLLLVCQVFSELGYHRTTTAELAQRCGGADRYRRFHERIRKLIDPSGHESGGLSAEATAWALIGLATVSNIIRELDLLRPRQREDVFATIAKHLVQGDSR
jgi:hypothetical protein